MATAIERANLDQGASETLKSVFACLKEATAIDGSPRYADKTLHDLRVAIVCRTYAKPIYELCHLIAALGANKCLYVSRIWQVERGTKFAFKVCFQNQPANNSNVSVDEQGLTLAFADGTFTVTFGRMPFLNALLDFLFTSVGFDVIDHEVRQLSTVPLTMARLNTVAKTLQRLLYDFLQDHLPPIQKQRKERHLLGYLNDASDAQIGIDALNDDTVLHYWRDHAGNAEVDVVTFEGVYRTAWQLVLALEAAQERTALQRARPIGTDWEQGEVEPSDAADLASALFDDSAPLDELATAVASNVRLLSERELDLLRGMPMNSQVERRLSLSVIRNATHGFTQRRLTAALRRNDQSLATILEEDAALEYRDFISDVDAIIENLNNLSMAALWALHQSERPAAIDAAMRCAPDIDWGGLITAPTEADIVVSFSAHTAAMQFYRADANDRGDEVSALLNEAKQAWSKTNRAGFKDLGDDDSLDVLAAAIPAALDVRDRLRKFLALFVGEVSWAAQQAKDAGVFGSVFRRLYFQDDKEQAHGD